jgi:heat-inducible transcriptional repressor
MESLSLRQQTILNRVVEMHIETGEPVGSRSVTLVFRELYRDTYSPATVRHEMGCLEALGFLTHPHISAGRVPTDSGYRFYVEHGLRQEDLPCDFTRVCTENLTAISGDRDGFEEKTSRTLSDYSEEAGILLVPLPEGRKRPRAGDFRLRMSGVSRILEKPEFCDIRKVRDLFKVFEEKAELVEWLTQETARRKQATIRIGKENKPKAFQDCTVVSATYASGPERTGVVAVIGPRRMRYSRTIPVVERVRDLMEEFFRHASSQ